ncbi:MAG: hypothetical protein JWP91_1029 [Fibrobacteres bacterium]|nr:hypothetical protein [Fibrobacterota bacterium]
MAKFALKLSLFMLLAAAAQAVLSLDYAWQPGADGATRTAGLSIPLKIGLPPLNRYKPDSSILLFQSYMKPHPRLGFLFKENLGSSGDVKLQWADQEPGAIHSDETGFINSPFAIAAKREGKHVDVIGVGSSFMQGAAEKLHDFFWAKGLFYYSMSTPRHTLQQFTAVVEDYAAPLKPGWIVYDLNEASFELITDFDEWKKTDQDWFSYHSGTWCGPTRRKSDHLLDSHPALEALYVGMRRRIAPIPPIPLATDKELEERALREILRARDAAEANGIRFLVMTIPSRDVAIYGKSTRWYRVESILPKLRKAGVDVLDLKPIFAAEDDPRALYFKVDAHWNGYGIFKAAAALAIHFNETAVRDSTRRARGDSSQGKVGGI